MKVAFFVLVVLVGIAFAYRLNPIPTSAKPIGTSAFLAPKILETTVSNPDGDRKLIMSTQKVSGTTMVYTFFTEEGGNRKPIFTQTTDTSITFSVPPNAWSPGENTYVFIKEQSATGERFLVLKSSGQPFTQDQQYLDVTARSTQPPYNLRIRDITGWDAPELLHVFTVTDEGSRGSAYWFNVETNTFLQLASS